MALFALPAPARRSAPRGAGVGEWDRPGRLPADLWRALLADAETVRRYHQRVYRRDGGCWYWTGALSSSGYPRLRAGSRVLDPDRPGSHVVAGHVFGWQISRGLLHPDPVTGQLPVIRHSCDEALCCRPGHWVAGSPAENTADYAARGHVVGSPLTDRRGPGGRARAIRDAILAALGQSASPGEIEAAIQAASSAGLPGAQQALPF
jgi:hypothetical protein